MLSCSVAALFFLWRKGKQSSPKIRQQVTVSPLKMLVGCLLSWDLQCLLKMTPAPTILLRFDSTLPPGISMNRCFRLTLVNFQVKVGPNTSIFSQIWSPTAAMQKGNEKGSRALTSPSENCALVWTAILNLTMHLSFPDVILLLGLVMLSS